MVKSIAAICLSLTVVTSIRAQEPNPAPDATAPPSRAVMTGEQVVRILDETVDWYRMLGVQQQSATQPSDLLILYGNRQAADRVVALAFELARANAELLSSEAEISKTPQPTRQARRRCCNAVSAIWMRAERTFKARSQRRNGSSLART